MIDPTLALDIVAKVTVIWAAAALASLGLARGSAARRHQLWALALGASIAMPALTSVAPRWTIEVLPPSPPGRAQLVDAGAPVLEDAAAPASTSAASTPTASGSDRLREPTRSRPRSLSAAAALGTLWVAGALLVFARFVFGTARLWWIARGARRAIAWEAHANDLAEALGIDRRVQFLSGGRDVMPMAWGLLHPRVLLPSDADAWPASRLRVVLLHELAHVKRRDCLTQLVAHLACAIYWFHPMVWVASRRLRAERERACDDLVLAAGTRGSDYADHLLDIARTRRAGTWPTWSAVTMAHRSQLEGRLMAILDPALPRRSPTRASAAFVAGLVLLGVVTLAGVRPVAKTTEAASPAPPEPSAPVASAATDEDQGRPIAPARPAPAPAPAAPAAPTPTLAPLPEPAPAGPFAFSPEPFVRLDTYVPGQAIGDAWALVGAQGPGGGTADPKVVTALTGALADEDKQVRAQALRALVSMRAPIAPDVFMTLLKDDDPDVRQQAAVALGRLRDVKYVDVLAAALKDENPEVRHQAAFALGQLRDARAIDPLTVALKDGNAQVRHQAAFALGQLRDARAVDPLTAALKDSDPEVRHQAAFALGQIRDRRAIDPLIAALKDSNAEVRRQAAFALGQIR